MSTSDPAPGPRTDPQTQLDSDPVNAPDADSDTQDPPAPDAGDETWTSEGGTPPSGPAAER